MRFHPLPPRYYKVDLRTITLGVPPQEVKVGIENVHSLNRFKSKDIKHWVQIHRRCLRGTLSLYLWMRSCITGGVLCLIHRIISILYLNVNSVIIQSVCRKHKMIHQDDDYEIDSNKKKIKLDSKGVQRHFEQNLGGKRPPLHLPLVPGQSQKNYNQNQINLL